MVNRRIQCNLYPPPNPDGYENDGSIGMHLTVQSNRLQYTPSAFARTSLLHLTETGTLTALRPHTSARENLGGYLLLVVEQGCGAVSISGKEYGLHPNDVAFVDCSKSYSHSTSDDLWTISWCHFDGPSMSTIYGKFLERSGKPVFHSSSGYGSLLHALYNTAKGDSYVRDMKISTLLNVLLEHVMEDCWCEEQSISILGKASVDLAEIKYYLDKHFSKKITLEGLSRIFFIDRTYLSRTFKRQYGINLMDYLTIVRINKVKELLRFGVENADGRHEAKLAEIAELTGFSSESYLSLRFKKIEGISPSEYRDKWK